MSSVALLVKSLSRWPERTWLTIAKGVSIPTSNTMSNNNNEDAVQFSCGNAFGKACHLTAPKVTLSEDQRSRLLDSLDMLKRELYDGNDHCQQTCGEKIA